MADNFDTLKMVDGITVLNQGYFNNLLADWNSRLQRLEEGGLSWAVRISGAVSAGRKYLMPVPTKLIKASFGFSLDGTVTTKVILDVFTGADRDTQGTSVWGSAANRPEIDVGDVTGFSGFSDADTGLPFDPDAVSPIKVLGIEVAQGAGPSNLIVMMRGEPGA